MEPELSPPRFPPEHHPSTLPTLGLEPRFSAPMIDQGSIERFMTHVREQALGVIDIKRQYKEYEEAFARMEKTVRKNVREAKMREEESEIKQSLEADVMRLVLELQMEEVVGEVKESMAEKVGELKKEVQAKREELEAKEKELCLSITEKTKELKKKEEEFELKQEEATRDIDVKRKALEVKEMSFEEMVRDLEVRKQELEARHKDLSLFGDTITEKSNELKKKEEEFQVKQDEEARDVEEKRKSLEVKEKNFEEQMREHEARQKELRLDDETIKGKVTELEKKTLKQEAEAKEAKREVQVRTEKLEEREKVLSSLVENVQERCNELEKREEQFQLKAKDAEVKRKELEEIMSELDAREKERRLLDETIKEKSNELEKREEQFKLTQDSEAKEIEVKMRSLELREKELEEREELLKGKKKEFDERSIQAENRKRSRNESESPLFAENDGYDNPPLIHTGKRHKLIIEKETDLGCGLYGRRTSTDLASASASASEANGREVYQVECIDDDGGDEDPEPYNCLDADFNNFNNTMSSFSVGQVWALYDPSDHMPRFYALIRKVLELQLRVEVTWLEPTQSHKHKQVPIACGEFKYGDKTTRSHLVFSHLMLDHIRTTGGKKKSITINPRKGETWALFRDWSRDKQQKRPYSYDFVQVLSHFDSVYGIGVAYLGRVEGFTSVYEFAEQNKVLQKMIPCDEMVRFSHRVPSFELDEKDGVPAGSFELDPAAIPRDYLEGLKDVKEEEKEGIGRSLGLSLVQV